MGMYDVYVAVVNDFMPNKPAEVRNLIHICMHTQTNKHAYMHVMHACAQISKLICMHIHTLVGTLSDPE